MIESLIGAALIFGLRIIDVSIGTIRTMFTVRGRMWVSAPLAFVEGSIFIFAISRVLADAGQDPIKMVGYALGFAAGTIVGITVEGWIASGTILVRVISPNHAVRLRAMLLNEGFGVTAVRGEGRDGEVVILFVVAPRRRRKMVVSLVQRIDPDCFVTIEPIAHAIGGHLESIPSDKQTEK